jgi:Fe-S oxidoreductase
VAVGAVASAAAEALESTSQKFNPFGRANSARLEWAHGLDVPVAKENEPVELLYWVGCAGAFDPAGREVTRAMVAILKHLRVPYRVLGCAERCTGDPARRLGEEGLWRELADQNRRLMQAHEVRTILTHCPHCFHAFRNEYPQRGPMPQVVHHSQWLRQQLEGGALRVRAGLAEGVTFHDPCYLGRANDETEAPRAVLDRIAEGRCLELPLAGKNSFCCGGGGGQVWLDVKGRTRVEVVRAEQIERTGARTVATGCPFCRVMLEAGRSGLEAGRGDWRVKDLAELVVEQLAPEGDKS